MRSRQVPVAVEVRVLRVGNAAQLVAKQPSARPILVSYKSLPESEYGTVVSAAG